MIQMKVDEINDNSFETDEEDTSDFNDAALVGENTSNIHVPNRVDSIEIEDDVIQTEGSLGASQQSMSS